MEKQELLEQELEAFSKYRQYDIKGNFLLASYWKRKQNKLNNMIKLAAALTKREIKANGITRLNIVRI
jgi:hypothetical protein